MENKQAPYPVAKPTYSVGHHMVTTAFDLPGFRIVRNLGVVRGTHRTVTLHLWHHWRRLSNDGRREHFNLHQALRAGA